MRRSYSIYKNQVARAAKNGEILPYDVAHFRAHATQSLNIGCCTYCNGKLDEKNFSGDHALPIKRGGTWESANLLICCMACNRAKGMMDEAEFRLFLAFIESHMSLPVQKDILGRMKAGTMRFVGLRRK